MPYALGLDSSTQSCSVIVIDTDTGSVVAEAAINFGESLPQYEAPSGFIPEGTGGVVHSDPLMWLDALERLLGDLKVKCDLSKITAVSGAAQQLSLIHI